MKSSRFEILKKNLDIAELNLKVVLLRVLPQAERKGINIFFNSEYRHQEVKDFAFHPESEKLLKLSQKVLKIVQELPGGIESTIGQKYISLCEENVSANEHRKGPKRLARELHEFIKKRT